MNLDRDKTVEQITSRLKAAKPGDILQAEGTWGSFAALPAAASAKSILSDARQFQE